MIRKLWMTAAAALTLAFAQVPAIAQQYGPPSSGPSAAILFVPAILSPVAGGAETPTKVLNGGGSTGNGGPATAAKLDYPVAMAFDSSGNLFFADQDNFVVRRIDHSTGDISIFAGTNGTEGNPYTLGGGVATSATIGGVAGLVVDSSNNVYVSDRSNQVVFKITPGGTISVFAGGGSSPTTCSGSTDVVGDGCLATQATINNAWALGIDSSNNIYIADSYNELIRKVSASTNIITAYAGVPSDAGTSGTCNSNLYTTGSGPYLPSQAHLCFPEGIAFDSHGDAFISEAQHDIVREINSSTGYISIFAGTANVRSSTGNGGPATSATLNEPSGVYVDAANRVYISDPFGGEIRMVDSTGNITDVMGNSSGELIAASFGEPDTESLYIGGAYTGAANGIYGFAMDVYGNIVATDSSGDAITSAGASGGGAYYFGSQQVYSTVTTTSLNASSSSYPPYVLISNPSGVNLTFTGTPVVTGPFAISGGTCVFPGTLTPGESCTVIISFSPIADVSYTGTITLDSNANSSPNTINLSGAGIGTPTYSATITSPSAFTSPVSVTSATKTATLTNTGEGPLTITLPATFVGGGASDFGQSAASDCPTTLNGGAVCHFYIDFTPAGATSYSAQLQVVTAPYGYIYASVSGTGTAALTPAATPVITPAAGTYNAPVGVQITDASTSPTIYDTTNGTAPTTGLTPYSAAFTVSPGTIQVQAIATAAGNSTSATATATYTVQPYLIFNAAQVGIAPGSAQQLTAKVSLIAGSAPTATLHYGHDYTVGAVSCTPSGSLEICTVPVSFIPTLPGARRDALFLMNGSTRLATVLLDGTGQAPFSLVQPGVLTQPYTTSATYLFGSIVDENGTAYVLGTSSNLVITLTKAGVSGLLPVTGLNSPRSISIDGAGVLYIHGATDDAVMTTYDTVQGIQGTVTLPGTHFWQDTSIGNFGNLYAVAGETGVFYTIKTDGTSTNTPLSPAVPGAASMTVDSSENVFIYGTTINEITAGGTQSQISSVGGQNGLAVDAADTLYASPYPGFPSVAELPASNYSTPEAAFDPAALSLGGSMGSDGTLYVGNYSFLDKVDRSKGAIAFGSQTAGTASVPQNVGIYNGGNQNLTLSTFGISGTGFALQAASSNNCTIGMTIAPGALCQVAVTLTPPNAGTYSGSVTFTTNSLNAAGTVQTVALSGYVNGIYVTAAPNPLNFANQIAGTTSGPQSVTLTNNGALYTASIGSIISPSGYNVSAGTCTSAIAPAGGTCQLSVTFAPTLAQAYNGTVSLTATSSGGGPTQNVTFAVNGTGTSAAAPVAALAPSPVAFTNQTVGTTSGTLAVTLSNTGSAALNISGISIAGANPTDFAIGTGTNACDAVVAAGSSCFIYVTFTPASATSFSATLSVADNASGSPQTAALTGTGISFVSNVGSPSAIQTVTVTIATAGTLNSILALTQGTVNLEFAQAAGSGCPAERVKTEGGCVTVTRNIARPLNTFSAGACSTGVAYTAGQSCTVNVVFTPLAPGARNGAVVLTDSSGVVLGTTYLPGTGVGPQLVFGPGVQSTLPGPTYASSYQDPLGITVDALGNVYVADTLNGAIAKIPWSGSYGTPVRLATGPLNQPSSVAVDGAGNLFIADTENFRVLELPWNGSVYGTPVVLDAIGLPDPQGVAVDGNGNLYIADALDEKIVELPWTSSGYGAPVNLPVTGLAAPHGMAVDANQNLYIADSGNRRVVELPWTGTAFGTQIVLPASGLFYPEGVAVDGGGNVYIADTDHGKVDKLPWSGTAFGAQVPVPFTLNGSSITTGIAVDGGGNIYLLDGGNNVALKLTVSVPPALSFASTNVGSTSSDSPKTVPVTNIGNASLTFSGSGTNPNYPANFPVNSTDAGLCSSSAPLTQGASCDVSVNFIPTASGSLSGYVVLTDNNLNYSGTTQSIAVSGTGVGASQPVASLTPNPIAFNSQTVATTSSAMQATLSNTGGAALTGIVISIAGANPGDFALTTGSNACGATLAADATCYIYVTFTPGSAASFSATLSVADNASGSPQTATLTGTGTAAAAPVASLTGPAAFPSTTVGATAAALSATLSNTGNAALTISGITIAGANPADFAIVTGSNACGSSLAAGASCSIYVIFTPASAASFAATLTVADNATGSPHTAALTGTGTAVPAPIASLTAPAAFPNTTVATTSAALTATLSNTGNAALAISGITLAGTNPTDFAIVTGSNACNTTLAAGASCSIYVTFTPASAANFSATLTVADNAAGSPQTAALTGTGTAVVVPTYTVASPTPAQTVQPGGAATYTINVTPVNGSFTSLVTLSASGLPTGATATFAPASVTPGSAGATSQLTIQTAAVASAEPAKASPWPLAAPALGLIGLFFVPGKRRRRWITLGVLLITSLGAITALSGCGGGFGLGNVTPPPSSYTITVTGTSGSSVQTTTVQLTVQ
jgi:sugar lactone lactonase YvrE